MGELFTTSFTVLRSLSVAREYLALGGGPPRFLQVCLSRSTWGHSFRKAPLLSSTGLLPAPVALSRGIRLEARSSPAWLYPHPTRPRNPRYTTHTGLNIYRVWAVPFSLAATGGIEVFFLFLRVLRCFTSPGYPLCKTQVAGINLLGCPIRESPDRSLLSNSPKLIAACHALHRLLAPRHPP